MRNWRTNLGGALGTLGTALVGIGVVPQLSGVPNKFLTYTAVAGFFLSAFGKFFHALFSADAANVSYLADEIHNGTTLTTKPETPKQEIK
jgi:hypothetical protein